jgi:hypothetical protein
LFAELIGLSGRIIGIKIGFFRGCVLVECLKLCSLSADTYGDEQLPKDCTIIQSGRPILGFLIAILSLITAIDGIMPGCCLFFSV